MFQGSVTHRLQRGKRPAPDASKKVVRYEERWILRAWRVDSYDYKVTPTNTTSSSSKPNDSVGFCLDMTWEELRDLYRTPAMKKALARVIERKRKLIQAARAKMQEDLRKRAKAEGLRGRF